MPRPISTKHGLHSHCPHCNSRAGWFYETSFQYGERVSYWRCILCGERSQDHVPELEDNPMLRHNYPATSNLGGPQ